MLKTALLNIFVKIMIHRFITILQRKSLYCHSFLLNKKQTKLLNCIVYVCVSVHMDSKMCVYVWDFTDTFQ